MSAHRESTRVADLEVTDDFIRKHVAAGARHGAPPIFLSLAIDRAAHQAAVTLEDHGPGIVDPKRMLLPFERGDASRSQAGAGLGLAIVARIVERHAGTLDIGAVDGGGTRVTVRLPLS